jgi:hypothetical protein
LFERIILQLADALDSDVGLGILGYLPGIMGIVALTGKDGGYTVAPMLFEGGQQADFVVDHDVVPGRIFGFHVVEFKLFVHIDKDVAFEGVIKAGAIDFARLEDDVAVAEDDGLTETAGMLNCIERLGKQAVGEGIVDHEIRNREELRLAGALDAIALEGSEVIGITEFGAELLEDLPVAVGGAGADFGLEMALEIGGDAIIIDERVVDVEEEYGIGWIHEFSWTVIIN